MSRSQPIELAGAHQRQAQHPGRWPADCPLCLHFWSSPRVDIHPHVNSKLLQNIFYSIYIKLFGLQKTTMQWYLVFTKPGQEAKALSNLQRQGYVCYLPTIPVEKVRQRTSLAGVACS
jgi:hypothetical protein